MLHDPWNWYFAKTGVVCAGAWVPMYISISHCRSGAMIKAHSTGTLTAQIQLKEAASDAG